MSTNNRTQKKRRAGRPSRFELLINQRKQRREIGQHRDLLIVQNKDPKRHYRWVSDVKDGQRLLERERDGYRYETDPKLIVSSNALETDESDGANIRKKAGGGHYLYLMSIEKELFEAYQELKADEVDATEDAQRGIPEQLLDMQGVDDMEFYGEQKIELDNT